MARQIGLFVFFLAGLSLAGGLAWLAVCVQGLSGCFMGWFVAGVCVPSALAVVVLYGSAAMTACVAAISYFGAVFYP